jgi:hypothetical protein
MTVIPGTSHGVLKLAGVAALGALLTDVVVVLTEGLDKSFTVAAIPHHVGAIAVGGLLGWMYELLRELSKATTSSVREISSLTSKISYQDEALSMLLSCPRHNDVLTSLIAASMRDNFRNVPYVGVGEYLRFLSTAVEHSGGFQGIQRKTLRWFRDTSAAGYLEVLRDRKMARKTRIFVIEPDEIASMEEDLADQEVLDYYWEHGGDVDSYWISTEQFRKHCPRLRIPDDFGLYDGALLIAYDADHQVLTFNLVEDGSVERRIFESQRQLEERGVPAFKRISRAAATP